ncbi:hemin uptake protein HemP [Morganella morganii subsp. morganii]|uniref:Hemin uptake protein HemP n=1 Tax=Salmonella enterica subsp. enterica serovar Chester TaxID=149386 RepID=A0A5U8SU85_SALET|nr:MULTISPECIES: hemin uptake protein HemP [Morganella]EBR9858877.1 hemin uptake protein HemP [Salmonella enterica subsp. enterica serovar Chester]ATF53382.1 hemin uptake protein HemP [Morganella morganii]AUR31714.1 hemin uptake protein HemP [Morganella morganii]AUU01531.1 hemin uptake protein HemP [Morganella morganii]AVD59808.1 hemin uptake protein HemP [Morganella morganii]
MTENNQNSVISVLTGYKNTATDKITVISSEALLGPQQRIIIRHQNEEYHLRRTKNGKLILTK